YFHVTGVQTCALPIYKDHGEDAPHTSEVFEVGKARTLREGYDATIIVSGGILSEAQKAAETLSTQHQLEIRIVSMHTIKPFDKQIGRASCRERVRRTE